MANELCAYGFGWEWDGTYLMIGTDHWSNGSYYIYRDSYHWFITDSDYKYGPGHRKAEKAYVLGSSPVGNYTGVDGYPNGTVKCGSC